jgi:hypothetical protein
MLLEWILTTTLQGRAISIHYHSSRHVTIHRCHQQHHTFLIMLQDTPVQYNIITSRLSAIILLLDIARTILHIPSCPSRTTRLPRQHLPSLKIFRTHHFIGASPQPKRTTKTRTTHILVCHHEVTTTIHTLKLVPCCSDITAIHRPVWSTYKLLRQI